MRAFFSSVVNRVMRHMVVPQRRPMVDDPKVADDPMTMNRMAYHYGPAMHHLRRCSYRHQHARPQQAGKQ